MKKPLLSIALAGVLVALGASSCAAPGSTTTGPSAAGETTAAQATSQASAPSAAAPAAASAGQAGSFTTYTPEAVSSASESEKVILFFHATWCSTCKLLASDIEANAASIPAGVKILKVDYDSETALKQNYGVTLQHTLVQVKPDGSQIAKWSLSRDLNALVKEIR
ncbi:thioredoxin domain-containing protein [Pseudarthrobacter sp. AL07]|uniref:thioredoxin domain-containing protein n=1 Tax=unclassified Pseudarthrobacter TaxID=2647000 RepID=UPI00249B5215|nr:MULTISPECIES: thioredoxin domain-containing protein [unclassified Pseudarthrobacter]MDI3195498.1 thioredoxin domain-containing protein [Pseudarthrobacter sp. AL20]MDI3209565.1 thioredoxin domain-containing protein [Pseudarthrobacter sp. AL07]